MYNFYILHVSHVIEYVYKASVSPGWLLSDLVGLITSQHGPRGNTPVSIVIVPDDAWTNILSRIALICIRITNSVTRYIHVLTA
jgi:hypothetical protein